MSAATVFFGRVGDGSQRGYGSTRTTRQRFARSPSTDADGLARIRGFLGSYLVTASIDGNTAQSDVNLSSSGATLTLTVC
jgi:hypothetical protein